MDPVSMAATAASALGGVGQTVQGFMNYALQRENLDWQKQKLEESWAREDNAVQRRARDMSLAGINPLLAAGSPASSSAPIRTEAPQLHAAEGLSDGATKTMAVLSMSKDFAVKDAQAQLLQDQADNVKADTELKLAGTRGKLMENQVYRVNNMMDLKMDNLGNALDEVAASNEVQYAKDKLGAQQALQAGRRAEAEAMNIMVSSGVDRAKAEALAAAYGADIAKNQLAVSDATLPAHIAGAYADVAGKAVGVGSNLTFGVWLKNFLSKSGSKLDKMSKFVDKYE